MFHRKQLARLAVIGMLGLALSPLWAREGGGFRGGSGGGGPAGSGGAGRGGGAPAGGGGGGTPHNHTAPPSTPHASGGTPAHNPAPAVVHNPGPVHAVGGAPAHVNTAPVVRGPALHGAVGIHEADHFHHEIGANHFGPVHGGPAYHDVAHLHAPGPHWNNYHQAYIGNRPLHLAYAGYRPSYYYHPWYHGPWAGHSWGWGWGFGPGLSFGFAGSGFGVGVGTGWGYPAYYGPYGRYGYWGRPLGWGFGGWGLGATSYSSGYYPYYNPYYVANAYPTVVYNYSTPIPVAIQQPTGTLPGSPNSLDPNSNVPPPSNPAFDMARDAFKRGDYMMALSYVDTAIKQSQSDSVMHEFRSLTLFALRDYRQSAAVIHSVLAVGPGWDWTTMSSLYPDPSVYTAQVRTLDDYTRTHPRATDAHFLMAYHSMIGNQNDRAAIELQQVTSLMPADRLAKELLTMVKGPPQQASNDPGSVTPPGNDPFASQNGDTNLAPPGPGPSQVDPPPFDKNVLPGTWNASRSDGSKFRLTIAEDGRFTWKYSAPNQKGDEFAGTYTVDGPVLALERKEGGALAGTATFMGDNQMNFKMVGGPPEDKGLDFVR